MTRTEEIRQRLDQVFTPRELEVIDDSEKHRGHAGYQEGGESHFSVKLRAEAMRGLSRIARHRAVHEALGATLMTQIHALSLDLNT